uniref:Uncharacterized protein n=1 Tax=Rhizophora mucronata TaxID=61149 RepID=A0A2P2PZS4_RHIMU
MFHHYKLNQTIEVFV